MIRELNGIYPSLGMVFLIIKAWNVLIASASVVSFAPINHLLMTRGDLSWTDAPGYSLRRNTVEVIFVRNSIRFLVSDDVGMHQSVINYESN